MAMVNNFSYVVNDGGGGSSYDTIPNLQVSFVGSPSAIDVSNSNWKSSSKSSFNGEGIDNLQLKVTTGAICIRQIKIYIDGLLFRTLEAYGGTIFWATTNVMALEASDVSMHPAYWSSVANISLTNDDTKVYGGNPYAGMKITQRSSVSFTSSGYKTIKAEIKYYPGNWDSASNPPGSQMVTKTLYLGSLEVKNPVISELSLSGYTNSFWVNQTFSKGNLSVKAIYKYQVANTEAHTDSVSGYSVSSPDMSTYGTKRITVSYSSKTAYYDIYVYGIQSFTKPVLKSYFKLNEALTSLQSTVTFTNGQTTTVAVVISFDTSTIGTKTVNYSIYVSTTKETKTWTSTASVFGIASISINTDNVTKRFDYDDTFSYSGLVVTASYGLAGSVTVPSGYGVEVLDWSVGTNKTVAVSYAGFIKTYSINIDGLYAVDFNIENCALYDNGHFRINKGGAFISGGKTCSVRRYSNGTLGTSTTWSGSVSSSVVDTSSIGTKQVTFSITEDGVTLSQTFDVVVFDYNELVVTNAPKKFFIKDGVLPTLSIGGMSVVAKTSDAKEQVLTLGALNNGYRLNPEVGTTLTSNRKIEVLTDVGLTAEFEIQIEENHPVDGATISVEGTLEKGIYSKGEQIDLTGLTVKVSEMAGGETDYEVDFTAVIDGKDNLIFDDNDDIGLYDLVISVDGIEDSVILEDAVVLDGISSLSNVISNKVYKSGEKFDITQVSGTVNLVSGLTRPISVNDISPINQDVHYGDSTITLVICGISTTVNISVIKVLSLTITPKTPTWLNYSFGQAFDRTKFTAKVKYSDNTTEKTVDVNSLTFAFTESSTIVGETLSEEHLLPTDLESDGIDAKLSFTEDGFTVESPFHILVKAIVNAKLYDQNGNAVNKVAFEYGQALNIDENVIKITYNDGTTSYDVIDADTIISDGNNGNINRALVKTSTPISAHIVATCGSQRALASFTIHCHYLSALNVDFDGIEDEDMFIYDTLDVSNVTAERVISSTDEDDDSYPQTEDITEDITFTFNGQNIGLNNYKFPSVGTFELVAKNSNEKSPITTVSPFLAPFS